MFSKEKGKFSRDEPPSSSTIYLNFVVTKGNSNLFVTVSQTTRTYESNKCLLGEEGRKKIS